MEDEDWNTMTDEEFGQRMLMLDPLRYKIIRKTLPPQHGLKGMDRINVLAKHKHRTIWHTMDVIRDTLQEKVSKRYRVHKRTKRLAKPRKLPKGYQEPRPTGPGTISKAALKASTSERTEDLAEPRKLPEAWEPPRYPYWIINKAALTFQASSYLSNLAISTKLPGLTAPSYLNLLTMQRKKKRAPHPKYTNKLAKPRDYHEDYVPDRIGGFRPIDMQKLLEYKTPERYDFLCRPLKVYPRHSREWVISKAALKYKITPRLDELAQPRKIVDPFIPGAEEIMVED